jgi:pilus assembly protein Flp/PilA
MLNAGFARIFLALKREEGQAMAEYGIILALIAAVVILLLVTLGGQIKDALQTVVDAL